MIILARDSFFSFHCILFPSMRAGRQEQASGLYRRRHSRPCGVYETGGGGKPPPYVLCAAATAHCASSPHDDHFVGSPRAARGAAAPETNRKKEPGVDARPVFALSVQPTAAMNPRTGGRRGSKVPGAPSMKINAKPPQKRTPGPFFPPISLGRNGGARRAGAPPGAPRCENVEPLIRPSVRTGTPSPQRGEGRAVDKPSSRRIRREE